MESLTAADFATGELDSDEGEDDPRVMEVIDDDRAEFYTTCDKRSLLNELKREGNLRSRKRIWGVTHCS